MENETATYGQRLRDLEADIDVLADAVGVPRERSITQRLDMIGGRWTGLPHGQRLKDAEPPPRCPSTRTGRRGLGGFTVRLAEGARG
ncbi:hypothetical protein [Streptomyces sp. NPDC001315]|uniref:hypothetical protein n=1 Tax=Streptomyces sp. NPDC001315 TaxID=3364562 RepID=UPI00369C5E27